MERAARKPIKRGEHPARLVLFGLRKHAARLLDVELMDQPARGRTVKVGE
jgi:hypothetical protein